MVKKQNQIKDAWNPCQYEKFSKERDLPFEDLIQLISPEKEMTILDLGCGTGHLTQRLHETFEAKKTIGIDSSSSMLKICPIKENASTLIFQHTRIEDYIPNEPLDLIFSNAALQWVPEHEALLTQLTRYLSARGQFAIHMPNNFEYPSHALAKELAAESPFKELLINHRDPAVLPVEVYSQLLFHLGFKKQLVKSQVYPHILDSTQSIIEWVKGSLLTFYQSQLPPDLYQQFLEQYQNKIYAHFGDVRPFFMPFKRILLWASR